MMHRPPLTWKRLLRNFPAATVLLLSVVLTCCSPTAPTATPTPGEDTVATRVAATLTALATAAEPTVPPIPTYTSVPPSPSPTPSETAVPETPTWTLPQPTPTATSTPTGTSTPVITDWRAEYYPNRNLAGAPALVANVVAVDFNWGEGTPAAGLPYDDFSCRWTRTLDFEGVTYRFSVYVDDGVRLWVDDELIIDAWYDSGPHTVTAERALVRGKHRIKLEYYEHVGTAIVQLWWQKVEAYPSWKGEYWPNAELAGSPSLTRNDETIDFNWGVSGPVAGLPADNFSVRWTRTAQFDAMTYRFHALVDDGVRVWVDDLLVIDAWYDHQLHELTTDYALVRGLRNVRVEYYERGGGAQVRVWWEKVLSPSYPDWKGEYWANRDLSGSPALIRNDKDIDFDWGTAAAAPGLPGDNFAVRWTRVVDLETAVYRFSARADDGIRFYVDGELVLDEWHDGGWQHLYTVDLTLAGRHELELQYLEHAGLAQVKFWWTIQQHGPARD